MTCVHKFSGDLTLENLHFQPTTLIVGTFNPGWDNLSNYAEWFYGRTRNNYFWEVLPRLYGETSLRQATPSEWKTFCKKHRIALTDLISAIDDAYYDNAAHIEYLKNYRDDLITRHFKRFTLVNIPNLIAKQPTITQVYLTRSINDRFWQRLWQPVADYSQNHGIKTQTLLTPSGGARFQIPKSANKPLSDFIFEQWRENWH